MFGFLAAAARDKVNERDAIRQAQRSAFLASQRNHTNEELLKRLGDRLRPSQPSHQDFTERMCDGRVVKGVRVLSWRTIPPRWPLGRPAAPWCPRQWSKTKRAWCVVNGRMEIWK